MLHVSQEGDGAASVRWGMSLFTLARYMVFSSSSSGSGRVDTC